MKMAILGAGGIAGIMATTIAGIDSVESYAIGSRDKKKAEDFANKYGFSKSYGSYEEMLEDDQIDLVYIAVPHSHHEKWTLAALNAGKNVLCEKPMAVNETQVRNMCSLAKEKGLLLAEAIWTRYMPSRKLIDDIVKSGIIGEVKTVSANLGYKIDMNERMIKPELAGGSLLDLSVYTLNFASMILGDDIKRITASCVMTETFVDGQDNIMIEYNNGCMASLFATMYSLTDRMGLICGTEGFVQVQNINNPEKITVFSPDRNGPKIIKEIMVPKQITGYEYEVMACEKAIKEGLTECPDMPHEQTLEITRQMDIIRKQFGIKYPFE
ncbi:MAG: Gfo/Idh/MocA family oxidoreductase [Lachnospiraceae bacterium]|nr:Gfo/Idh/MocA family oxidoreductase [Lachnospiraceae bacterium]